MKRILIATAATLAFGLSSAIAQESGDDDGFASEGGLGGTRAKDDTSDTFASDGGLGGTRVKDSELSGTDLGSGRLTEKPGTENGVSGLDLGSSRAMAQKGGDIKKEDAPDDN